MSKGDNTNELLQFLVSTFGYKKAMQFVMGILQDQEENGVFSKDFSKRVPKGDEKQFGADESQNPYQHIPRMSENSEQDKTEILTKIFEEMLLSNKLITHSTGQSIGEFSETNQEPVPNTETLEAKLSPFDTVFLPRDLMDDIIISAAIPELVYQKEADHCGIILHGEPGTGKTEMLLAIGRVYANMGAYSKELSLAQLNTKYVSDFAKNIEREIKKAIDEAEKRGITSFLFFDEATVLAQDAKEGASNVSKHYQEAIDVLKKYVGNDRRVVLALSMNEEPYFLDEALIRPGRLKIYHIGHPEREEQIKMWRHFVGKYTPLELTIEQAEELADLASHQTGAFIEMTSRTYIDTLREAVLEAEGHQSYLAALKSGADVSSDQLASRISYETLRDIVEDEAGEKPKGVKIGFLSE